MSEANLVIFDLDGTLINSVADLGTAVNYALRRLGYAEWGLEEYKYKVGSGVNKLLERALPEGHKAEGDIAEAKVYFMEYYMRHKTDLTRPYEGIPELLRTLSAEGVKLAVCSNKFIEGTRQLVAAFFPDIEFASVLGQREGVPVKPDPAIVYETLEIAGCSASECLYVGDSGIDMHTAVNAGTIPVGVTWGFRPRQELLDAGAVHIVDAPQEIVSIVKG